RPHADDLPVRQHALRDPTQGRRATLVNVRVPSVAALVVLLAAGVARAEPAGGPAQAAADAYAENALMIVHVGKPSDAIDEKGSSWRPLRGLVYRFSLEPPEFLDVVGRPDLADHERSRHSTARTLSIVGDIVIPIGLFTALYGLGVSGGRVALIGLG